MNTDNQDIQINDSQPELPAKFAVLGHRDGSGHAGKGMARFW